MVTRTSAAKKDAALPCSTFSRSTLAAASALSAAICRSISAWACWAATREVFSARNLAIWALVASKMVVDHCNRWDRSPVSALSLIHI